MKTRILIATAMVVTLGFVMMMPVTMTGCSDEQKEKIEEVIKKNKDNIVKGIYVTAKSGAKIGLSKWAEKKPEAAKETAAALARNIENELIPYFEGGDLKASAEIQEFINSSLFKDIPDEVKFAVVAAASVLDVYLPVPDSETYLEQDHVDYIVAFLKGVKDGAKDFSGTDTFSLPDSIGNKWIR
jgi:hypothetical protein